MGFRDRAWWGVLAVIVAAGVAVLAGDVDDTVDAGAAFEVWGDVVRDVDQFGLTLAGISAADETRLGRELAAPWMPSASSPWQDYVDAVGRRLTAHVRRRGIDYRFHVLAVSDVNAFALPGGDVFVTEGLLEFLRSEAELAFVLGHEIAHVDQRHAIERLAARIALERIMLDDLAGIADLGPAFVRAGYRKYQELEADLAGMHLASAAGYDPDAAVAPLRRLAGREPTPSAGPRSTPLAEAAGAVLTGLGSYLDTHPVTLERVRRLEQLIAGRRWWGRARHGYRGVENHRRKVPRAAQEFPDEA
ncbi:MAG: M48 family metalloprotease [Planctomycetaceae bacterium]